MQENVLIFFNVLIIFGAIVYVIKTLSDNRLRQKVADKGIDQDLMKTLFAKESEQFLSGINAIKWGMVLMGIGLAVVLGRLLFPHDIQSEATFGLAFIFAGLAFIIYFMIYKSKETDSQ